MIKIVVVSDYQEIASHFEDEESKKDLFLTAKDDDKLLTILRFKPQGELAVIKGICQIESTPPAVLDGIIRTALFQMADMDTKKAVVYGAEGEIREYFLRHGFQEDSGYLIHDDYVPEFFKPCPGCVTDD